VLWLGVRFFGYWLLKLALSKQFCSIRSIFLLKIHVVEYRISFSLGQIFLKILSGHSLKKYAGYASWMEIAKIKKTFKPSKRNKHPVFEILIVVHSFYNFFFIS
jgi:hypothetical protein